MILLANGKVITRDPNGTGYYPDGGVVTDGGKIVEVGTTADLKAKYPQAEFVDAKGGVIMPGLINAHTHIYSALARGLSINGYNPTNFYEVLDGQWWYIDRNLDLEATKASAQALVIDSIKQGVTTIFDHHASFCEIPGSLMKIAEVTKEFGMRACLCYEVSDRDGEEKSLQSVQENKDFIDYCEQNPSDMLKAMFGGHALFTISDKTFDRMVAANNGRVGYHIHVSEGMNDVYDSLQNYGRRPCSASRTTASWDPRPSWATASTSTPPKWTSSRQRTPCASTIPSPTWATPWAVPPSCSSIRRASWWVWAPTPTPTTCWRASR